VSVEAISWALNLAPVPVGRGGQSSTACKYLLTELPLVFSQFSGHADGCGPMVPRHFSLLRLSVWIDASVFVKLD
jgi:hypothetical protein